jgi:hypothetical protein
MRKQAIVLALAAAAGLAGCGAGSAKPYVNDRDAPLPPGQGMLGDALTWRSTRATAPQGATPATVDDKEEFQKWRQSSGNAERQEFEEWRAWQEWKRNNPKK